MPEGPFCQIRTHMLKLMGKKLFTILRPKFYLSKPVRYLFFSRCLQQLFTL